MRRLTLSVTALALLAAFAVPVGAAGFDPDSMIYPLDGENRITDSFGDCRGSGCARSHEGVDIMTAKGTPVLAAGAGVVTWISDGPSDCCYLGIDHGDGWLTRYIHLNDDLSDGNGGYLPSTDGQGWGIVDGIVEDTVVVAGQHIGWAGDSGNAAEGVPHLHFELRRNGSAIDPYAYLVHAKAAWIGIFSDDDGSVHENNIEKIFTQGITVGCNPPLNDMFCPARDITRGEMAAFLARSIPLTVASTTPAYDDVDDHLFELAIDKLHTAGIAFGCDAESFCPDRPLERDEMAELLVRAFGYENPDGTDFFSDDADNPFQESINKLANAGITVGCNPPDYDHYCPDRNLSRAEMATFFVRSLDL